MALELLEGFVRDGGQLVDDDGGNVSLGSYVPLPKK
jgi:hypothetical protein